MRVSNTGSEIRPALRLPTRHHHRVPRTWVSACGTQTIRVANPDRPMWGEGVSVPRRGGVCQISGSERYIVVWER